MLHLALRAGDLDHNLALMERGIAVAAAYKSNWVLTPELSISGYQFPERIGTEWIAAHPDKWTEYVCSMARTHQVVVFLGHAARGEDNMLYNCVSMIDDDGSIIGHYRKIAVVVEPWATPGRFIQPVGWKGLKIGMLICADAYTHKVTDALMAAGSDLLVSPCAWGPGENGPEGEWEQRSAETGLPLFVCNRTGRESTLSFLEAESLVIRNGERLLAHRSPNSVVLTFHWDVSKRSPSAAAFEVISLD